MINDEQYTLRLQEDPIACIGAEGLRVYRDRPLLAHSETVKLTNRAVKDITGELKALLPSELNSTVAKDLLERRDLEDILYS